MYAYTADQWILFFFFYCLCGWVWECCYVSARQKHWVNRGFLYGPVLPIYGFGAVIILLATIPVAEHLLLVYIFGTVSATALEYVTGAVMERLFKVRYWDYSDQICNFNGYICLSSSVAWGFFAILLVRFIHPPIHQLITRVPPYAAAVLALGLIAVFFVDVMKSVRAAMDLREMLEKLTEENEELRRLARRVEVLAAFAEDDLQKFREKTQVERILLREKLETQAQRWEARKQLREKRLAEALRTRIAAKLKALENISAAAEAYRATLENGEEAFAEKRAELDELLQKLREHHTRVRSRTEKTYRQSLRILRANPSAKARQFAEAMESLRKLEDVRRD